MYTVLYYPHTHFKNEALMKIGLLLWDRIEYISPSSQHRQNYLDRDMQAASELVAVPHRPSDEEKQQAHEEIEKLVNSDLPEWFFFIPENPNLQYEIYPTKFLDKTWEILRSKFLERPLVKGPRQTLEYYSMSESFGISLMSILAECCAGSQKRMLTFEQIYHTN